MEVGNSALRRDSPAEGSRVEPDSRRSSGRRACLPNRAIVGHPENNTNDSRVIIDDQSLDKTGSAGVVVVGMSKAGGRGNPRHVAAFCRYEQRNKTPLWVRQETRSESHYKTRKILERRRAVPIDLRHAKNP